MLYLCLFAVTNGKNGKAHVLTLQDKEQDNLQFDLSADLVEELFKWYQIAWDITQRQMSKEIHRQQEVRVKDPQPHTEPDTSY